VFDVEKRGKSLSVNEIAINIAALALTPMVLSGYFTRSFSGRIRQCADIARDNPCRHTGYVVTLLKSGDNDE
jgi:hypothetical protein